MKSIFDELDQPANLLSGANPAPSTAEECLAGAGAALAEAIETRRIAYERFMSWAMGQRDRAAQAIERRLETREVKMHALSEGERTTLSEWRTVEGDRRRAEAEVTHWRELVDWWRHRASLGMDRTYGASSVRQLIRDLADKKAAP